MTAIARTETAQQRAAIFAALTRRNRLVRVLRVGLPAIGAILLSGLVLQVYIGSLVPDLGFANVTIDRDNLVVGAPVYSGTGTDGTTYAVRAATARTSFTNIDAIDLTDAVFDMVRPADAPSFTARAHRSRLTLSSQVVTVDGVTDVEGSDGLAGTVVDAVLDVEAETLDSSGAVDLTLPDGTNVKAATMSYDGKTQIWTFRRATVLLDTTPGEVVDPALGVSP